jgi:hypothetical protein
MKDPLIGFDWSSLHQRYDDQCKGFDPTSKFLAVFEVNRPESERTLYCQLLELFSKERRNTITDPLGAYEAFLYWMLFSQFSASYNLNKWFPQDAPVRKALRESLIQLFQELPTSLDRNTSTILKQVKWLDKFQLPGMASSSALPARTTFLHFLYPTIVPIFTQMVLRAVGVSDINASHRTRVLEAYLPFAWKLAEKYVQQVSIFRCEGPIRVIDMALWVCR